MNSVLDVGCGIGRMAIPLARYLNTDGKYEGFDIIPENIAWCQRAITPRYPQLYLPTSRLDEQTIQLQTASSILRRRRFLIPMNRSIS